MTIKYNDPYGNRNYAQLKGDKSEAFFKLVLDEARFYKQDDGYLLWAYIKEYQGVVRSFKPENPIEPGLCAIPFYDREYQIRRKDKDGTWHTDKQQPSIFEVKLCKQIAEKESFYTSTDSAIMGFITHIPNAMLSVHDLNALSLQMAQSISVTETPSTDKLPDFNTFSNTTSRGSYGRSKAPSMEEKLAFIKKQMEDDILHVDWKSGKTLAELTDRIIEEHSANSNFIEIYFDLLMTCVR